MIPDYKNPDLTIRQRVADLLSKMTLKEKVGQVNQHLYGWQTFEKKDDGYLITDYLKEHVEFSGGLGALYGVLRADPWSKMDYKNGVRGVDSYLITNQIQKYVMEHSRLGIPVLFVEECPHGHQGLDSVSYPTNIGKGNSFNVELIKKMAQLQAKDFKTKGIHLALVSTLDLAKDPRWGRTEECFGEDPFLSAQFSKAIIEGFQGQLINDTTNFLDQKVSDIKNIDQYMGVVLKHFIAQGDIQGGHNSGSVVLGERDFHEIYGDLGAAVKNACGVMAAYNDIDGIPCHGNKKLLTHFLRDEVGYNGLVMADGTALDRLVDIYGSYEKAAIAGLVSGVDLSLWDTAFTKLEVAINTNPELMPALNTAVSRVLSIKFLLGLFDNPYTTPNKTEFKQSQIDQQNLNLEIARQSLTLLKNQQGILPLQKQEKIAVIGPSTNDIYHLLGDYTAPQNSTQKEQTIFKSLQKYFPNSKNALGCEIRSTSNSETLLKEALSIAEKSDTIVVFLGGSSARTFDLEFLANGAVSSKSINMDSGENVDVASLSLGGAQSLLFDKLSQLDKKIITVLIQGRPHQINEIIEKSDAVIVAWYPGQMGGKAIAQTLCGENNPSGKLSISYPRSSSQLPDYYYQRDAAKNDDYYDMPGSALFDFGFGLHYGEIRYSNLICQKTIDGKIKGEVTLTNVSQNAIDETVLIYAKLLTPGVLPFKKRLVCFDKVRVAENSVQKVEFIIESQQLQVMKLDNVSGRAESVIVSVEDLTQQMKLI